MIGVAAIFAGLGVFLYGVGKVIAEVEYTLQAMKRGDL